MTDALETVMGQRQLNNISQYANSSTQKAKNNKRFVQGNDGRKTAVEAVHSIILFFLDQS